VAKQVKNGIDVLITNPSLLETGLDLNDFTTLIYYNIGYNLFTFRQSSRRSWRINQTFPRIEVYILYYAETIQARAIRLMASKLAAATIIEGNLTDEGLAAMSECNDMTALLAKELTLGIKDVVADIGETFKKMAVIHDNAADMLSPDDDAETAVGFETSATPTSPTDSAVPHTAKPVQTPIIPDISEKVREAIAQAVIAKRRKKAIKPLENQISMFDDLAS
jgi:type IV secretory pathway VirJ component